MIPDLSAFASSKRSAIKSLYTAFTILKENKGEMPRKLLIEEMSKRISFESWEEERYESNGQLKWLTIFLFYTVDCVKAGWLTKDKKTWYLTPDGEKALNMGPIALMESAGKAYRDWASAKNQNPKENEDKEPDIKDEQIQKATLEQLDDQASEGIGKYLESIDAFKFQKISAALIRVMGFYVDYNAKPGPDGGVDIIAYKDPLGFEKPRIKIQVKKYSETNKVGVNPVRELRGLLNINEHIGIFITSGFFTKEAELFARQSDIHIKLINRDELIELWQKNYHNLIEEEKALLPLHPIYFLGNLD